jgi:hypothetical protein
MLRWKRKHKLFKEEGYQFRSLDTHAQGKYTSTEHESLHCQNTSYMVKDTLFLLVSSYEVDRWLVFLKTSALFRRTFKINNFHSPQQKACLWLKNVSVVHVEKIQIFQGNIWENKIIHTHDPNSFYYSNCPIYFTFFY